MCAQGSADWLAFSRQAPEVFIGDYGLEADVWAAGMMMYQLLSNRFPWWSTMEELHTTTLEEVRVACFPVRKRRQCLSREGLSAKQRHQSSRPALSSCRPAYHCAGRLSAQFMRGAGDRLRSHHRSVCKSEQRPFVASQVMQAVIQRDIPMDYGVWKTVSPECRDLIRAMLTRDPAHRISAADAMQHAWFRSFGIGATGTSLACTHCSECLDAHCAQHLLHRGFRTDAARRNCLPGWASGCRA